MEVIGAIASVGAILGGTRKTFDFVRSIAGIEDDWQRLNDEVCVFSPDRARITVVLSVYTDVGSI